MARRSANNATFRSVSSTSPVPVSPKPRTPKVSKGKFLTQKELSIIDFNLAIASKDAQTYMAEKHVPEILESLAASLMLEKPDDPLQYLDQRLEDIKTVGAENVNWDTFIKHMHPSKHPVRQEMVRETGTEPVNHTRENSFVHQGDYSYNPDVFKLTEMVDDQEDL